MAERSATEERILRSARKVFRSKGLHGARMQDIADQAGINKALLHYYFRNKELLFEGVLRESLQELIPVIRTWWEADLPLEQKIKNFINGYIDLLRSNPMLPVFIFHEIHQDVNRFHRLITSNGQEIRIRKFLEQIQGEANAGRIKLSDPRQLVISMLSLCVFPFVAKPMIMKMMGMKEKEFDAFTEARKEHVIQIILQSIKK